MDVRNVFRTLWNVLTICNPTLGMNQIFDHCFSLHFLDWGGGCVSVNESMFENGQHNIEKLLEFNHPIVTFFFQNVLLSCFQGSVDIILMQ